MSSIVLSEGRDIEVVIVLASLGIGVRVIVPRSYVVSRQHQPYLHQAVDALQLSREGSFTSAHTSATLRSSTEYTLTTQQLTDYLLKVIPLSSAEAEEGRLEFYNYTTGDPLAKNASIPLSSQDEQYGGGDGAAPTGMVLLFCGKAFAEVMISTFGGGRSDAKDEQITYLRHAIHAVNNTPLLHYRLLVKEREENDRLREQQVAALQQLKEIPRTTEEAKPSSSSSPAPLFPNAIPAAHEETVLRDLTSSLLTCEESIKEASALCAAGEAIMFTISDMMEEQQKAITVVDTMATAAHSSDHEDEDDDDDDSVKSGIVKSLQDEVGKALVTARAVIAHITKARRLHKKAATSLRLAASVSRRVQQSLSLPDTVAKAEALLRRRVALHRAMRRALLPFQVETETFQEELRAFVQDPAFETLPDEMRRLVRIPTQVVRVSVDPVEEQLLEKLASDDSAEEDVEQLMQQLSILFAPQ